jgi:hypothetical protein
MEAVREAFASLMEEIIGKKERVNNVRKAFIGFCVRMQTE